MKIIVELRRDQIIDSTQLSVELKKRNYKKVQLLNIADDVTASLLTQKRCLRDTLAVYGKVETLRNNNSLTNVPTDTLDITVVCENDLSNSAQEFLFKANTSLVVNDAHSEIAKLWLFH